MGEILRRVALVVGVYGTLLALLHARAGVVEASLEDFAARQARRPGWSSDHALSLAAYVAQETKDRAVEAAGSSWASLAAALERIARGAAPEGEWAGRRGTARSAASLFLLPDELPLAGIEPPLGYERPFVYARSTVDGAERWVSLTWRRGADADTAPPALTHPLRASWPWLLLGGLALYALIPRRRVGAETLRYSPVRAGVLPDLVGLMLGGLFFALALAVPRAFTHDGRAWQPEAWPLYAVAGVFLLFAWTLHAAAAWYSAFRLELRPDGLALQTLLETRDLPYARMLEARLEPVRPPKALRRMLWVGALFSARLLAQSLLSSSRSDQRLVLVERDGHSTRLLLTALEGAERLRRALEAAGVRIVASSPEVLAR